MEGLAPKYGSERLGNITGIVFLLDDVIYDRQDWLLPAICFASERMGMDPDRVAVVVDDYVNTHGFADSGIYNHILLGFGQSDSVMNIRAMIAWVNRYIPAPGSLFMYSGVQDALTILARSHEMALLSQGNVESQKSIISALGAGRFFEHIVHADEIDGMRSRLPDERSFKPLLKGMRSQPADILFVGNNPRKHFSTPSRLGCTTVRCMTGEFSRLDKGDADHAAHYSLTSAARLPSLLGASLMPSGNAGNVSLDQGLQGLLDKKARA